VYNIRVEHLHGMVDIAKRALIIRLYWLCLPGGIYSKRWLNRENSARLANVPLPNNYEHD
jgi:hypothetical protein